MLVVVSIIALLVGLLLPTLRRAREQSKQLICRNNLTSMWKGVFVYSTEYRDRIPFIEQIDPRLDPFDPAYPTLVGNVLGPYVERGSFVCPSAVAGYPSDEQGGRSHWKLTYDFSTADRDGPAVPYDSAPSAHSGRFPDPAISNNHHFDGRPLRMLSVSRDVDGSGSNDLEAPDAGDDDDDDETDRPTGPVEIVWNVTVPLIADTLGENRPGDLRDGRPVYPHRGVVSRYSDVSRSLATMSDPRVLPSDRPGYFHLHAERDHPQVFLTRHTPDREPED